MLPDLTSIVGIYYFYSCEYMYVKQCWYYRYIDNDTCKYTYVCIVNSIPQREKENNW